MRITVVIPTLDEEEGIGPTMDAVDRKALKKAGHKVDFLVIDGGSRDRTCEEARARGARVVVEPRRGYGRAYKTGFREVEGELIVTADADGTYPLERLAEYVELLLTEDLDFLTCDRYADLREGAMSAKHRLGNRVLSTTARVLFRQRIRDSQSGMWLLRRSILPVLDVGRLSDGMAFSQEIKIEAFRRLGQRAREVPASLAPRIGQPVIASWRDGLGNLRALLRHRFRHA